ncbi:hypothetical protein ACIRPH_13975 [Nocardiopsis sp. NPDC101807]|uniref:hypothetical protein n=1 Tax=Nocardiopsis sp. NPDC101807 TaxID=3364339 RepID=UPI0038010B98
MPVLIMILVAAAALAVLVGVVYVVLGKGGQLARFEADYPPLPLPDDRAVRARDLGRVMLPLALWGYHVRAVDELLLRLTTTLREREERIEDLEWRLSRLDPSYVPEGTGPLPGSHLPGDAYAPGAVAGTGPEGADAHGGPGGDAGREPADPGDGTRGESADEATEVAVDDAAEEAADDAAVGGNQR